MARFVIASGMILVVAGLASAAQIVTYGWEDGAARLIRSAKVAGDSKALKALDDGMWKLISLMRLDSGLPYTDKPVADGSNSLYCFVGYGLCWPQPDSD